MNSLSLRHLSSQMGTPNKTIILLLLLLLLFFNSTTNSHTEKTWVRAGFWYSGSEFPISDINSGLFTHLICSFALINSSTHEVLIPSSHQPNFHNFASTVKRKNPKVVTVLAIWAGGENQTLLQGISRTDTRDAFIKSAIGTAREYGFHGIDISGVFPDSSGDGQNTTTYMSNLGTLLEEFRAELGSESRNSSKAQLILTMLGYYQSEANSTSYPFESMRRNLDWVHLMAYDYHIPTKENKIRPHAALFDPTSLKNTDFLLNVYISKGIPATQLVMGLPYHGWAWKLENPEDNSVGASALGPDVTIDGSMGYKNIRSYIRDYGFGANAIYNGTYVTNIFTFGTIWINFDDVETIRTKVFYAKRKGLLGYHVFQVYNDKDWILSKTAQEAIEDPKHKPRFLIIILVSASLAILLLCSTIWCMWGKALGLKDCLRSTKRSLRRLKYMIKHSETLDGDTNLRAFSYTSLKEATNNFLSENRLGKGGFGPVYKGKLLNGQKIAVKRLSTTSSQGHEEFKNEVMLTARLQHVNLTRLLGFCTDKDEKMLVYEYMPGRSLDFHLFDPTRKYLLNWEKRMHIIEGVTQGLLYLQEYSNFTVIHRDLKASNILLDNELNAKISDFGMARLFGKNEVQANTRRIVGTYGYVPPEYVRKGIYSMKYDVYSFGVLLLQIVSGKRTDCYYGPNGNLNLLEHAYELWKNDRGIEFIDPALDNSSSFHEVIKCMHIALLCVQEDPVKRPTMLEVSSMLKNEAIPVFSPKRPAFSTKKASDEETKYMLQEQDYSINYAQITDLVPR